MKFNTQYLTFGYLAILTTLVWFGYGKYQDKAKEYHNLKLTYNEQVTINTTQQERIQQLAELDTQHTQELANAQIEIDTLRTDVAAGRRKLRIKATCPVSETTPSGSVDATTTVELTGETGSTVLDIRAGIINDRAKLRYLQDYINTECYKVTK
ncbi:lysis protein [Xenorhabdus sp. SF857]|uniref:lysis protein n=1 Tax=Xenorhabdus bakwenae TaxID=3026967 RepID=UPI0025582A89|nr:lysis protein [Xenorhabdus sp. SF857]WFQ80495.1 lysis protein [Xenorhabdus sp. SF857]